MRYTDRARAELDSYLAAVHRGLADRDDVDAADVVAGITEHVEAALAQRGVEPATAEDVAEVLERLGSPESIRGGAGSGEGGGRAPGVGADAEGAGSAPVAGPRGAGIAALVLVGLGLALLSVPALFVLSLALVATGVVLARLIALRASGGASIEARLALVLWWSAAVVGTVAVVVGPAVLVWAQAQPGGLLEGWIRGLTGRGSAGLEIPLFRAADDRRGLAMSVVVAGVTALWWVVLAGLGRCCARPIRRLLGPASILFPPRLPRVLITGAAGLLILLMTGVVLLWLV